MNTIVEVLNGWGTAWAGFMVRALIDVSVLLAVVMVVWLPLRKRMSAQLAHGLFCLVLLKLFVPAPAAWPAWVPGVSARQAVDWFASAVRPGNDAAESHSVAVTAPIEPLILPTTGDLGVSVADSPGPLSVVTAEPVAAPAPAPRIVSRPRLSLATGLMLGWGVVTSLLLLRFVRAVVCTRKLMREAVPIGAGSLPVDVEALQGVAGVRTSVRWAVSPEITSPAVGGLVRPTVVIPPDLDDGLTPKQLAWVLLHELAHVRRGDLWVASAQRVVQALFFFHPAVHVANWIIDQLREYACDDVALAACKTSRFVCGEGFLTVVGRTVERVPAPTPALGLFESRMLIRRRLLRILDGRRKVHERLSPTAALGLLAAAVVVLPYGRFLDVSAHSAAPELAASARVDELDIDEPASYRPREVWRRGADGSSAGARATTMLAIAYSPDGATLATAGEDGAILLRDVASGALIGRLEGHRDAVCGLAFSPDGRTLATCGYDHTVRLWNVATQRPTATLKGHTNWVFAVAFSPDGKTLASAGHDKTVRIWDVAATRELLVLTGHSGSVRAVAFSSDGNTLASGGADRVVMLWDIASRVRIGGIEGHRGTIRALAFSPDGTTLATASEDGETRLRDVASGQEKARLTGHADMVVCLAFSPRGKTLATGSLDSTVKLWDVASGRERATLQGHNDGVSALAFAPGALRLATAGFDGAVRVWEPAAPVFSPASCLAYPCEARALAFGPDGASLFAAGAAGIARWDAHNGSALAQADRERADALAVSPVGSTYATGDNKGTVRLIDSATGKVLGSFPGDGAAVHSAAFSANGRLLATGDEHGMVRLFGVDPPRAALEFTAGSLPVRCVRFSPDGRTLAIATGAESAGSRGVVVLWNIGTGQARGALRGHDSGVAAVAFSPSGRTIATAGSDGAIKLWNATTLACRNTLKYDACESLAFSPDGLVLASTHRGGDAVLWDAQGGRQLGVLKGHRDRVYDVAFAPDGRSLATAGKDGSVKVWNLAASRQTARASLKGDLVDVRAVAYSPDGQTLAVADGPNDAPGVVTLWDLATRRVKATLDAHEKAIVVLAFSPDGKTLAAGSWEGTIRLWDLPSGEERYVLTGLSCVEDLAFSPDGTTLASAGEGKIVTLWDVRTGDELARLTDFRYRVHCLAFSPDGSQLATGGGELSNDPAAVGEVKVWDVATRSAVSTLEGHERAVVVVAFSPDGRALATAGLDQPVRIWDVASGRIQVALGGLSCFVQSLAFSRDGRLLAWSGRSDGLVSVHDTTSGAEVARLVGHRATVRQVAFAPDGSGLATAGADRSVRLWEVPR